MGVINCPDQPKVAGRTVRIDKKEKVRSKAAAMNNCAAWDWEDKIMKENLQLICALVRFPLEVTHTACVTCLRCEGKKVSLMGSWNKICTK